MADFQRDPSWYVRSSLSQAWGSEPLRVRDPGRAADVLVHFCGDVDARWLQDGHLASPKGHVGTAGAALACVAALVLGCLRACCTFFCLFFLFLARVSFDTTSSFTKKAVAHVLAGGGWALEPSVRVGLALCSCCFCCSFGWDALRAGSCCTISKVKKRQCCFAPSVRGCEARERVRAEGRGP